MLLTYQVQADGQKNIHFLYGWKFWSPLNYNFTWKALPHLLSHLPCQTLAMDCCKSVVLSSQHSNPQYTGSGVVSLLQIPLLSLLGTGFEVPSKLSRPTFLPCVERGEESSEGLRARMSSFMKTCCRITLSASGQLLLVLQILGGVITAAASVLLLSATCPCQSIPEAWRASYLGWTLGLHGSELFLHLTLDITEALFYSFIAQESEW